MDVGLGWDAANYLHVWGFHEVKLDAEDVKRREPIIRRLVELTEKSASSDPAGALTKALIKWLSIGNFMKRGLVEDAILRLKGLSHRSIEELRRTLGRL